MFPTVRAGDFLLIWRWGNIKIGGIVVAEHPQYGRIVKRVKHTDGTRFQLAGDNQRESTSTEDLGWFTKKQLIGKLIWHISK